jgi:hypothetical protein
VDFIFFYGFCVFPFLVVNVVLVEVLVVRVRHVWRKHPSIIKGVPREVLEPRMSFNFVVSVKTKSAGSFTSETLIRKLAKVKKGLPC